MSKNKGGRPPKLPSERLQPDPGRLYPEQAKRLTALALRKKAARDVIKRQVIEAGLEALEKGG